MIDIFKKKCKRYINKGMGFLGYKIIDLRYLCPSMPDLTQIEFKNVELLQDQDFLLSLKKVKEFTLLDLSRLANLWQLSRLTDPRGAIIEIGSYKGGGALHLANSNPQRTIYVCDSFKGFRSVDPKLDPLFSYKDFKDNLAEEVAALFEKNNRKNYEIIPGFFPDSCEGKKLKPISFVHLDVDVYEATKNSLDFITPRLMENAIILLDDFLRDAEGVRRAVVEFIEKNPAWRVFPLFPAQGMMIKSNDSARVK